MDENITLAQPSIKIEKCSIILTYSFLSDEKFKKQYNTKKELPKVENLLNYVDRLFDDIEVKKSMYDNQLIYLYSDILYALKVDKTDIYFFDNDIAYLSIKLTPLNKDLESLYIINKALTNFYSSTTKHNYIYLAQDKNDILKLEPTKTDFLEFIKNITPAKNDPVDKAELIKITDFLEDETNTLISKALDFKLTKIKDDHISIVILKSTSFTKKVSHEFIRNNKDYSFYSPHEITAKEEKKLKLKDATKEKDYPFSKNEHGYFKDRIGLTSNESKAVKKQNENFNPQNIENINRNYLYFEQQKELVNARRKEGKYDFINYDTFITSLILKYVKTNDGVDYYDNFNTTATNYINSYITLTCDSQTINTEYKNNFISFEPLISSKTKAGTTIAKADYFNIFQSQADIFTIGNSHNIVHIIDTNISNMMNNKETAHFFIYLLTCVQRTFILNIINSSVVTMKQQSSKNITKLIKTYRWISEAVEQFNRFLTNYNFKVISNNSSVDNSYQFFRECNEIDQLSAQWSTISIKFNDWKNILEQSIKMNPLVSLAIVLSIPILMKIVNAIYDILFNFLSLQ